MPDEATARDLRIELDSLTEAERTLEGLALIDPSEQIRLERTREAIRERFSRLTEIESEARR